VVSDPNTGKSLSKELKDRSSQTLLGMKIGQEIDATIVELDGTLKISGGSDKVGSPMRRDVAGGGKNHILITDGVGFRSKSKGQQKRKLVRGNMITEEIYQINTVLIKGKLPEEKPAEEAKAKEKPAEEAKAKEKPAEEAKAKEKPAVEQGNDTTN